MRIGRTDDGRWVLTPLTSSAQLLIQLSFLLISVQNLPDVAGQATDDGFGQSNPPPPPRDAINLPIALMIMFLLCAFLVMTFISLFFQHRSNETQPSATTEAAISRDAQRTRRGLDAEVIESFPTFLYSEVKGLKIGKCALECAVCLNEFEEDKILRMMPPCNHVFHPDCIDVWLFSHSTCPVCRTNLVPKPEDSIPCTTDPEIGPVAEARRGSECPDMSLMDSVAWTNRNRPPRSRSTGISSWSIKRLFPRSHSTGHSVLQPSDSMERFTLRLPEEVRSRVMMNRRKTHAAFGEAMSSRRGYRSGSVGEERRGCSSNTNTAGGHRRAFSVAIPFGIRSGWGWGSASSSRSGSVKSKNGEMGTGQPKGLMGTIKEPIDPMFLGKGDIGESSSGWLRRNIQV